MRNPVCLMGFLIIFVTFYLASSAVPRLAPVSANAATLESRASGSPIGPVRLSPEEIAEFGVVSQEAEGGILKETMHLTGEIRLNRDRLAKVVSMVSGVVVEVRKFTGDSVSQGEVMAIIQSRELADVKSAYLAARERLNLATVAFQREEFLWKKKISSQQDYLEAKQTLSSARIVMRTSTQKLIALGLSKKDLVILANGKAMNLARYEIKAPISGMVLEKAVSLGEAIESYGKLYMVADMSTVWVDLAIYQKDLGRIREGLEAVVSAGSGLPDAKGTIAYVEPFLSEQTRTAIARIVLENKDGVWMPGLFVTAIVNSDCSKSVVRVPVSSIQYINGRPVIFVDTGDGFEPRDVVLGRRNQEVVEIISGLEPGERYVARGAFTIKCELQKASFASDED